VLNKRCYGEAGEPAAILSGSAVPNKKSFEPLRSCLLQVSARVLCCARACWKGGGLGASSLRAAPGLAGVLGGAAAGEQAACGGRCRGSSWISGWESNQPASQPATEFTSCARTPLCSWRGGRREAPRTPPIAILFLHGIAGRAHLGAFAENLPKHLKLKLAEATRAQLGYLGERARGRIDGPALLRRQLQPRLRTRSPGAPTPEPQTCAPTPLQLPHFHLRVPRISLLLQLARRKGRNQTRPCLDSSLSSSKVRAVQ
jgi:hypothetical protein